MAQMALLAPMRTLLIVAVAVCLLSTLASWVTGLPVQAAFADAEIAASTPTNTTPAPAAAPPGPPASRPSASPNRPSPPPTVSSEAPPEPTPDDIPASGTTSPTYVVQAGDTLAAIAQRCGAALEELMVLNSLADPNLLYAGQTLVLPEDCSVLATGSTVTTPPSEPESAEPTLTPPPEADEAQWIDVDLSEQSLTAYEGKVPVRTTLVSTGLPSTPTPVGQYRIWIKLRYDDMAGVGYYIEDVPFVMYFHEGYGLHGVTWHGNFGHPMSHGCVNLPTEEAEWLFHWADVGTLVNVHD
jgi:lipoprotein-anchoring transpeptidase ErfK/SrfK